MKGKSFHEENSKEINDLLPKIGRNKSPYKVFETEINKTDDNSFFNSQNKKKLHITHRHKLLPNLETCREIEIINNLSLDEDSKLFNTNLLETSMLEIKIKEGIDGDKNLNLKRIGKKKSKKVISSYISSLEKEFNATSKKEFFLKYETMSKEKEMENEILNYQNEINIIREKINILNESISESLKEIYNSELDVHLLDTEEYSSHRKNEIVNEIMLQKEASTPSKKKGGLFKNKSKLDNFIQNTLAKENAIKQQKIKDLNTFKIGKMEQIQSLKSHIEEFKEEINKIKNCLNKKKEELLNHYHQTLYAGVDFRQEGLIWIIKAIWNLGYNVKLTFFPTYLDSISVDYLFNLAHENIKYNEIKSQIDKLKRIVQDKINAMCHNNCNSINFSYNNLFKTAVNGVVDNKKCVSYEDVVKKNNEKQGEKEKITFKKVDELILLKSRQENAINMREIQLIQALTKEKNKSEEIIFKLKSEELHRIFQLFMKEDYGKIHKVSIENIIGALIGDGGKDKKLIEYQKMQRVIFNLNNIFINISSIIYIVI